LGDTDLVELGHQGFICQEKRGERVYHKLRFRRGGRQVIRYIGNAERAAAVEQELSVLQSETAAFRALKAVVKIANKMLRDRKTQLELLFASHGYAFHGLSIRRPRKEPADVSVPTIKEEFYG